MAVKEAQSGLDGVLEVVVRFEQKDATIRYLPEKVGLEAIMARYADTPFEVTPSGPVVAVARTKAGMLRGWSKRAESAESGDNSKANNSSTRIDVFVELAASEAGKKSVPQFSIAEDQNVPLTMEGAFKEIVGQDPAKPRRFAAQAREAVKLQPGDITFPVSFDITTDGDDSRQLADGKLAIVVRTPKAAASSADAATGIARIGGRLDLRLVHLCNQKGCVDHLHESLAEVSALAAVRPQPGTESPGATVHLRAGQPVDVWGLRQSLRRRSIEVAGIVPGGLDSYTLRVEMPRWRTKDESDAVEQCLVCRDNLTSALAESKWVDEVEVSGGGINFRAASSELDLVTLLEAVSESGVVPSAVWLVPDGAAMPKASPPQLVAEPGEPKRGGSNVHPVVEMQFGHTCEIGTGLLTLLGERAWADRTHLETGQESTIARAAIGDRKFANLTLLLNEMQAAGHEPSQIRLSEFGDVRVQLEFAHICGDVEYSKPPKRRPKKETKDDDKKEQANAGDQPPKPKPKPKKPFVPVALRPDKSSNGRQSIEAALKRVGFVEEAVFHKYHTRPEFNAPRKVTLAFTAGGADVVRLDELIDALQRAGFPPSSVLVSRRFPGIPFGKELPADLLATGRDGKHQPLSSMQQPGRLLAVAFVSLKCERYKDYQPDPKLYHQLGQTMDKYKDRVDFVAISASPDDRFVDVSEFWSKTGLPVPLLHDADGTVRKVFNAQATPPPHLFVFDEEARLRYAGDPHDSWKEPEKRKDDYLAAALDLVIAGKYEANGAVYYKSSVCNCSDPNCKCPKCGCGSTCRCAIKH